MKKYDPETFEKINKLVSVRKRIVEVMIKETKARDNKNPEEEQKHCRMKEDLQSDARGLAYELEKAGVENTTHRIDRAGVKLECYSIPLDMDGLDVNAFTLAAAAIESMIKTDIKMLEADNKSYTTKETLDKMYHVKEWYALSRDRIMNTMNYMNDNAKAQQRIESEKGKDNGGKGK